MFTTWLAHSDGRPLGRIEARSEEALRRIERMLRSDGWIHDTEACRYVEPAPRMERLPEKLSDLLELAVQDLARAERSRLHGIDMGDWHTPERNYDSDGEPVDHVDVRLCMVCLGGAVMAFSLDALPDTSVNPEDYDDWTEARIRALDHLRRGYIYAATQSLMNGGPPTGLPANYHFYDFKRLDRSVVRYHENDGAWKAEMARLVVDMREAGL